MDTLIFTHYGYSEYLKYTLESSIKNSGLQTIILIGDNSNEFLKELFPIEFYNMDEIKSDFIDQFNQTFKTISGKKHSNIKNGRNWTKYVFLRWFYIQSVIQKKNISDFWHFDSDTLILEDLTSYKSKFKDFDNTEQCLGNCANGYITQGFVDKYIDYILEMFKDESLINLNKKEFEFFNEGYALTEMRAYQYLKASGGIKSTKLNLYTDRYFDNILRESEGFEIENFIDGKKIKRLLHDKKSFYLIKNGEYKKLITVNLSWLPEDVYQFFIQGKNLDEHPVLKEFVRRNMSIKRKIYYTLQKLYNGLFR